jgi:glycosyltransferase involved in cell wall biosynthesis
LACVGLSPLAPSKLTESTSPTKPLEYMALGLPIVCNDLPDQARIVAASQAGWCVEFSAQEFASAILQCLQNPDQAAQMGQRGRTWVQANRSYRSLAQSVAVTLRQVTAARAVSRASL